MALSVFLCLDLPLVLVRALLPCSVWFSGSRLYDLMYASSSQQEISAANETRVVRSDIQSSRLDVTLLHIVHHCCCGLALISFCGGLLRPLMNSQDSTQEHFTATTSTGTFRSNLLQLKFHGKYTGCPKEDAPCFKKTSAISGIKTSIKHCH